jgi:hypothetical protein
MRARRAPRFTLAGRFAEFVRSGYDMGSLLGVICWMSMRIQTVTRSGLLTLFGLLVSACESSDHARPTLRSGASWARDLNEPPPRREPANQAVPRIKADLDAARERASR